MDSLGGSSLALMIACCSPSPAHVEETLSTLYYATRARNIVNTPSVQQDPREQLITSLRGEVEALRRENGHLRGQLQLGGGVTPSGSSCGGRTPLGNPLLLGRSGTPTSTDGRPPSGLGLDAAGVGAAARAGGSRGGRPRVSPVKLPLPGQGQGQGQGQQGQQGRGGEGYKPRDSYGSRSGSVDGTPAASPMGSPGGGQGGPGSRRRSGTVSAAGAVAGAVRKGNANPRVGSSSGRPQPPSPAASLGGPPMFGYGYDHDHDYDYDYGGGGSMDPELAGQTKSDLANRVMQAEELLRRYIGI